MGLTSRPIGARVEPETKPGYEKSNFSKAAAGNRRHHGVGSFRDDGCRAGFHHVHNHTRRQRHQHGRNGVSQPNRPAINLWRAGCLEARARESRRGHHRHFCPKFRHELRWFECVRNCLFARAGSFRPRGHRHAGSAPEIDGSCRAAKRNRYDRNHAGNYTSSHGRQRRPISAGLRAAHRHVCPAAGLDGVGVCLA